MCFCGGEFLHWDLVFLWMTSIIIIKTVNTDYLFLEFYPEPEEANILEEYILCLWSDLRNSIQYTKGKLHPISLLHSLEGAESPTAVDDADWEVDVLLREEEVACQRV